MDDTYVTYVVDERVRNHSHDDNAGDDYDNTNDSYARASNARVNTSFILNR